MGNKISSNGNGLIGDVIEAINTTLDTQASTVYAEPNTSTDSTIALPILKVYGNDKTSIPVHRVLDNTNFSTSDPTVEVNALCINSEFVPLVDKFTGNYDVNTPYKVPVYNTVASTLLKTNYTDEKNVTSEVHYNVEMFSPEQIRDMQRTDTDTLYSDYLIPKTIILPIRQSLGGDIVTTAYIPVVENYMNVVKEVGITSDGYIVSISYRNLYILLIIVLVLVLVLVYKYVYNTNTTNSSNTTNKR
jgi:hypothetical protein